MATGPGAHEVKVALLAVLAAMIVVVTTALMISVVCSRSLWDGMRGALAPAPALQAAAMLFGVVFIVVGAGAAVRYLMARIAELRRRRRP